MQYSSFDLEFNRGNKELNFCIYNYNHPDRSGGQNGHLEINFSIGELEYHLKDNKEFDHKMQIVAHQLTWSDENKKLIDFRAYFDKVNGSIWFQ